jgi:hypothetical protein
VDIADRTHDLDHGLQQEHVFRAIREVMAEIYESCGNLIRNSGERTKSSAYVNWRCGPLLMRFRDFAIGRFRDFKSQITKSPNREI